MGRHENGDPHAVCGKYWIHAIAGSLRCLYLQCADKYKNANDEYRSNLALKSVLYVLFRIRTNRQLGSMPGPTASIQWPVSPMLHFSRPAWWLVSPPMILFPYEDAYSTTCTGCDVAHPSPGVTNRPSVAGLVASVDNWATRYYAELSVQLPQQETISSIGGMIRVSSSALSMLVAHAHY